MPRDRLRRIRLGCEQHKRVARRPSVRPLDEQNAVGAVQHLARVVAAREEVQLERRMGTG